MLKAVDSHAQSIEVKYELDSLETKNNKRELKHNFFLQSKFEFGGLVPSVEEQGIGKYHGLD